MSVWFQVVIRADVNSIRIGDRVNIQDGSIEINVEGGVPPYNFNWIGPDGFSSNSLTNTKKFTLSFPSIIR